MSLFDPKTTLADGWLERVGSSYASQRKNSDTTRPWYGESKSTDYPDTFTLTNWRAIINELNDIAESQKFSSRAFWRVSASSGVNLADLARLYQALSCGDRQRCIKLLYGPDGSASQIETSGKSFFVVPVGTSGGAVAGHEEIVDKLSAYYPIGDKQLKEPGAQNSLHPVLNAPAALIVPIIIEVSTQQKGLTHVTYEQMLTEPGPYESQLVARNVGPPRYVVMERVWFRAYWYTQLGYYAILTEPYQFESKELPSTTFRRPKGGDISYRFFVHTILRQPATLEEWQTVIQDAERAMR